MSQLAYLLSLAIEESVPSIIVILGCCQVPKHRLHVHPSGSICEKTQNGYPSYKPGFEKISHMCWHSSTLHDKHSCSSCKVNEASWKTQRYFGICRIQHPVAQEWRANLVSSPLFIINQLRWFHWRIVTGGGTSGNRFFVSPCIRVEVCTPCLRQLILSLHEIGLGRRCSDTCCPQDILNDLLHLIHHLQGRLVYFVRNNIAPVPHACCQCWRTNQNVPYS